MNKQTDRILDFVRAAARIRREYALRQSIMDRDFDAKNLIIYAVDTPVFAAFTNPATFGPRRGRGQDYQAFPNDSRQESTAIASALGEFIFRHLSENIPLVQLPAHHRETVRVYDGIAKAANRQIKWQQSLLDQLAAERLDLYEEIARNYAGALQSIRRVISSTELTQEQREKEIDSSLEDLIAIALGRGENARREHTKYIQLLAEGRVIPVEALRDLLHEEAVWPEIAEALRDPIMIHEWADEARRTEELVAAIASEIGEQRLRHVRNIETDARAIARMEYYNARLAKCGAQIVLVTNDESLRRAIVKADSTWSDSLVCSPQGFLVEALTRVVNEVDSSNEPLDTWLNAILAEFTDFGGPNVDALDRLVSGQRRSLVDLRRRIEASHSSDEDGSYEEAMQKWEEIKRPVILWHVAYSEESSDVFRDMMVDRARSTERISMQQVISDLGVATQERFRRGWDELLMAFSTAGINLLYAIQEDTKNRQWRSRLPPSIRFDGFSNASTFVYDLLKVRSVTEIRPRLTDQIELIKGEARSSNLGNTDLGYILSLVFSVLCASEGKWYVAGELAQHAIGIARSKPETKTGTNISGREAYYLLALVSRLMATSTEDLALATKYLDLAREALKADHTAGSARNIKGLRFDAERLAVKLSEVHMKYWLGGESANLHDFLKELSGEVLLLLSKIFVAASNDTGFSRKIYSVVLANLYVNVLQVLHLAYTAKWEDIVCQIAHHGPELFEVRKALESQSDELISGKDSYLGASYKLFGEIFFNWSRRSISEIEIHFSDRNVESYGFVLYDKLRYTDLKVSCRARAGFSRGRIQE